MLDLISPPTGAHLISAVGDVGGFVHHDFTRPGADVRQPDARQRPPALDYRRARPERGRAGGQPERQLHPLRQSRPTAAPPGPRPAPEPAGVTGGGHGRRVRRRRPGRVVARAARACVWSADNGATWTPVAGRAGRRAGRVGPGDRRRRSTRFALGVFYVSTDGGATFTAAADRACRPTATCGSRRCPGTPATSGWPAARPACRTDCGARPTAVPRSPGWPAWTRGTPSASAGGAGPVLPGRLRIGQGPRACAASSAPTTRVAAWDADQRRRAPVGLDRRRHHRRPPGLRPGLRGHQRARHHRRRPRLMHARAPCTRLARYKGTLLTRRVRSRRAGRPVRRRGRRWR